MELLLFHLLTQIYLYPHYIISKNLITLIRKSYGLFQVEEIPEHSSPFMIANDLDSDLVEVLPAIHALTGCDTASKVGKKVELSGKELIVTNYCMHLAGIH